MNCKQGDLAIVVRGEIDFNLPNVGKILTCLRLATDDDLAVIGCRASKNRPIWVTDTKTRWRITGYNYLAVDATLRPLRGDLTNDDIDTQINREAETC